MKKIDAYIMKKYVTTLFFITVSLVLVLTLFNWLDYNDKYTRRNVPVFTIIKYYYYNVPYFLNIIIGICGLLASLLTFSNLGKYNELIALQASGIGRMRYITSVLIAAFIFSIGLFFFNELYGVEASRLKEDIWSHDIYGKSKTRAAIQYNMIKRTSDHSILQASKYDGMKEVFTTFNIQYFTDSLTIYKRIDADSVIWSNNSWLIKKPRIKEISHTDTTVKFTTLEEIEIDEMDFTPSDLEDVQFKRGRIERFLTIPELEKYKVKQETFGQPTFIVEYEIYNAIFFPFSLFFMTFIGALLGSINNRSGVMIYFFLCVFICLVYITIIIIGKLLGQSNTLSPFMGALLPHIITTLSLFIIAKRK